MLFIYNINLLNLKIYSNGICSKPSILLIEFKNSIDIFFFLLKSNGVIFIYQNRDQQKFADGQKVGTQPSSPPHKSLNLTLLKECATKLTILFTCLKLQYWIKDHTNIREVRRHRLELFDYGQRISFNFHTSETHV